MKLIVHNKFTFVFCLILIFVLFSRFYSLTTIPSSLVHDELIYVMQAKAIAYTGSDMTGRWNPFSLKPFNADFAELPSLLMVPGVMLFNNPIIGAKITHVLIGLFLPLLLGWLVLGIWKNSWLAIVTGILASVNPWIWQFSRMSFDPSFSLFFYLFGGGIILNFKKWWKLLSMPILCLGFFEYQGMKLVFVPWVLGVISLWLQNENSIQKWKINWQEKQNQITIAFIITFSTILLFSWYAFVSLPNQSSSKRTNQLIFLDKSFVAQSVMDERRRSTDSPLLTLTSNKYLFIAKYIEKNLFRVLNPNLLFISADEAANRFAVTNHGYFYLVDFFLVVIGLHFLLTSKKNRLKNILFLVLLLVSTTPAVVAIGESYTFRASLFYLLLIILAAHGLQQLKNQKRLFRTIVAIYLLSVGIFTHHYFFKYPVYAADGQFFSERVLANYVKRVSKNSQITIYTPGEEGIFNSYLFYNNLYSKQNALEIRDQLLKNTYTINNLTVVNSCVNFSTIPLDAIVIRDVEMTICDSKVDPAQASSSSNAKELRSFITLPAVKDNGELYRIYSDTLCSGYPLSTFISPRKKSQFAVEKLSDEEFCKTWFSDLTPLLHPQEDT